MLTSFERQTDRLLTLVDVADLTAQRAETIRREMDAGRFPQACRRRGRLLWLESEVAAYIAGVAQDRVKDGAAA